MNRFAILGFMLCLFVAKGFSFSANNNNTSVVVHTNNNDKVKAVENISNKEAEDFIKNMYDTKNFEDYSYLKVNCTPALLKKLKDAYDFDCDDGDCYAVWLFRAEIQDGPNDVNKVVSVSRLDNNWFEYSFLDMGVKGVNKLKLVKQNGKILIDDVVPLKTEKD